MQTLTKKRGSITARSSQGRKGALPQEVDKEERERSYKKLMEEVAADVVEVRVLALAGYEAYEPFDNDSRWNQAIDDGSH